MKELLLELQRAVSSGEAATLVTIVEKSGSTPRGVGTAMVVCSDGRMVGTIGGGEMEHRARRQAMDRRPDSADAVVSCEVHSDGSKEGDCANGSVTLLFRTFQGEASKALFDDALETIRRENSACLICPIQNGLAGGTKLALPAELRDRFQLESTPAGAVLLRGETNWFVEPLSNDPRVLLFGGGHVAQKTAAQLALLNYRVWVVEERAAFASRALFPEAEQIFCLPFETARNLLSICSADHAIVMTSSHESDIRILSWLLTTRADYIGCIGSRRKIAQTKETLLKNGAGAAQIARIHAPIGLEIGAETPAEIAVSIAAELIQHQRNQTTR